MSAACKRATPLTDIAAGEILEHALGIELSRYTRSDQMRVTAYLNCIAGSVIGPGSALDAKSRESGDTEEGSRLSKRQNRTSGSAYSRRLCNSASTQSPRVQR